jgi:hypothetical protein
MQARVENKKKPSTKKRMFIMIGLVLLLIVVIAGIKALTIYKMISGMKPPPPATVSTIKAAYSEWQPAADSDRIAARGARCGPGARHRRPCDQGKRAVRRRGQGRPGSPAAARQ